MIKFRTCIYRTDSFRIFSWWKLWASEREWRTTSVSGSWKGLPLDPLPLASRFSAFINIYQNACRDRTLGSAILSNLMNRTDFSRARIPRGAEILFVSIFDLPLSTIFTYLKLKPTERHIVCFEISHQGDTDLKGSKKNREGSSRCQKSKKNYRLVTCVLIYSSLFQFSFFNSSL